MAPRPSNTQRQQQLVEAASRLVHQQGFAETTLAAIASQAQMPSGSIYYYFRNKDDVVRAIVEQRVFELEERLRGFERLASPRDMLDAVIQIWQEDSEVDARYGCPIGSLCYELAKQGGEKQQLASQPLRILLQWCEARFVAVGHRNRAADLALHLLAALQGISLIANALSDPELIRRENDQLRAWLADL